MDVKYNFVIKKFIQFDENHPSFFPIIFSAGGNFLSFLKDINGN